MINVSGTALFFLFLDFEKELQIFQKKSFFEVEKAKISVFNTRFLENNLSSLKKPILKVAQICPKSGKKITLIWKARELILHIANNFFYVSFHIKGHFHFTTL